MGHEKLGNKGPCVTPTESCQCIGSMLEIF
jgi:hypothetical protein